MTLHEILVFSIIWLQPIFWMLFFNVKTAHFDKKITPIAIVHAVFAYLYFTNSELYAYFNAIIVSMPLFVIYSSLALFFSSYLIDIHNWHAPQAMSASAIIVSIGSYLWEVPYLLRNAFFTGFEGDWFLHLMGVFLFLYVKDGIGWTENTKKIIFWLGISISVSLIIMILYPVPPKTYTSLMWDRLPYFFNRIVASLCAFILMRKSRNDVDEWRMIQK